MGSANPQAMFDKIVSSNPDAQNAMNICNQYGNGDPKTAFFNYAREKGKSALAQSILNRFGLN